MVDEWYDNLGHIEPVFRLFEGIEDGFSIAELDDEMYLRLLMIGEEMDDNRSLATQCFVLSEDHEEGAVWQTAFVVLYRIGFLGVKRTSEDPVQFSYEQPDLLRPDLPEGARFYIHPSLYEALHVNNRRPV